VTASANLDLARSIYGAWERGDFGSVEWADPEIEYVHADGPDAGSWKGLTGMAKSWRDVLRAWEGYRVTVDEYRELDGERVLVLVRVSARGKTSGLELSQTQIQTKAANLLYISGGKVTRLVIYWDRARALADLGLAAEADPPA
jgi:ketosteroid isomerase-like protein